MERILPKKKLAVLKFSLWNKDLVKMSHDKQEMDMKQENAMLRTNLFNGLNQVLAKTANARKMEADAKGIAAKQQIQLSDMQETKKRIETKVRLFKELMAGMNGQKGGSELSVKEKAQKV